MKKLLVVIIVLMLSCAYAYAAEGNPAFIKAYPSSKGDVTFNHQTHAGDASKCDGCHSLFPDGVNKEVAHKACKSCHSQNNAPTKCNECHVK